MHIISPLFKIIAGIFFSTFFILVNASRSTVYAQTCGTTDTACSTVKWCRLNNTPAYYQGYYYEDTTTTKSGCTNTCTRSYSTFTGDDESSCEQETSCSLTEPVAYTRTSCTLPGSGVSEPPPNPSLPLSPLGVCTEGTPIYSSTFNTNPGIVSLGGHAYKIVDFPAVSGDYTLEYDWLTSNYNSNYAGGGWGFSWVVKTCEQSNCAHDGDRGVGNALDLSGLHYPDTRTGYNYALTYRGPPSPLPFTDYWGTPQTNKWYTIKIHKTGNTATYFVIDSSSGQVLTQKTFSTNNLPMINRIAVGTWNFDYMSPPRAKSPRFPNLCH